MIGFAVGLIMGTRLWYPMWDATGDDDVAFERRLRPLLKEIGNRCKVATAGAQQQPHEPTPAPALAAKTPAARATAAATEEEPHRNTSLSLGMQQPEGEVSHRPTVTTAQRITSAANNMASGSFAEMAAFIREELETMRQANELQRQEWEGKLESQRQEWEAKLETLRQANESHRQEWDAKLESQRQVWESKLEETRRQSWDLGYDQCRRDARETRELEARFQTLHASKLLSDDELYKLENLLVDNLAESSNTATQGGETHTTVSTLARLSERVANNATLARQLRRKYI